MLVKDIAPGAAGSDAKFLTEVNQTLFFVADDGVTGQALWRSDGTDAGTMLVKDIDPGTDPLAPLFLTNVNGTLFFYAIEPFTGAELWKSDGTANGTQLVKDIYVGTRGSYPQYLTNVSGTLFFRAGDGTYGAELWKSDGTEAGTMLVSDIVAGRESSLPHSLVNSNGLLVFAATDSPFPHPNFEPWRSDGTASGTFRLKDIRESFGSNPEWLTDINGTVFFRAESRQDSYQGQLWKTDGTPAGTALVKEYPKGPYEHLHNLVNVGGRLFYAADDGNSGFEVWTSDGTTAGTALTKDIVPGSYGTYLRNFTAAGGTLFFTASGDVSGSELWVIPREVVPPPPPTGVWLSEGVLTIYGTSQNDTLTVSPSGTKVVVQGRLHQTNVRRTFASTSVRRIRAYLGDGDDRLTINSGIRVQSALDGQVGNDTLIAGGGAGLLIGGPGDDLLIGGSRGDVLLGGAGRDRLLGNAGTDLVIGSETAYEQDSSALLAILREWTSARSLSQRIANLRNGTGPILASLSIRLRPNQTVLNDRNVDTLFGGADLDWFFADLNLDLTRDRLRTEVLNVIS